MQRILPFLLLLAAGCVVSHQPPKATIATPPERSGLLGEWIGFDAEAVVFYRVVLTDKAGMFAYSFPGYPISFHRIISWTLKEGSIHLEIADHSNGDESVQIEGFAENNHLGLTIKGSGGTWGRKVDFFREAKIIARMNELQQRMDALSDNEVLQKEQ